MARWEDALDQQLAFSARLGLDEAAREGVRRWARAEQSTGHLPVNDFAVQNLPDWLTAMAFNADTVYVEPDMMTVWESLIEGFQPEPLVASDLVTPAGFLWLPRPYYSHDIHGRLTSTRAVLWHPQRIDFGPVPEPRTEPFALSEGKRLGMSVPVEARDGRLGADGLLVTLLHYTSDRDDYSAEKQPAGILTPALVFPWAFGTKHSDEVTGNVTRDSIVAYQALWRLMGQRLAARTTERPDRHTRKRLAKMLWPERNVTVVRLRRHEPPRERGEAREVEWTHRWTVRRHWRMQPYPSLGPAACRQILIEEYVKGPEDKPLVPSKHRVMELVE